MATYTSGRTQREVADRTPRRWLVILFAIVLAVLGVGAWLIIDATQTDDVAVVTDLADAWMEGWNANDPEAVAAVFTEDGSYINPWGEVAQGRGAIMTYVAEHAFVTDEQCLDDITTTDDGTFVVSCQFVAQGTTYLGDVEIELDGDLASRIEWLNIK